MEPGLVKLKDFWLENMMVRCSGDQVEVWLGDRQRLFTRTIRRLLGQAMCGMGDLVGVVEGRLLRNIKTKVVGSFLPRHLH